MSESRWFIVKTNIVSEDAECIDPGCIHCLVAKWSPGGESDARIDQFLAESTASMNDDLGVKTIRHDDEWVTIERRYSNVHPSHIPLTVKSLDKDLYHSNRVWIHSHDSWSDGVLHDSCADQGCLRCFRRDALLCNGVGSDRVASLLESCVIIATSETGANSVTFTDSDDNWVMCQHAIRMGPDDKLTLQDFMRGVGFVADYNSCVYRIGAGRIRRVLSFEHAHHLWERDREELFKCLEDWRVHVPSSTKEKLESRQDPRLRWYLCDQSWEGDHAVEDCVDRDCLRCATILVNDQDGVDPWRFNNWLKDYGFKWIGSTAWSQSYRAKFDASRPSRCDYISVVADTGDPACINVSGDTVSFTCEIEGAKVSGGEIRFPKVSDGPTWNDPDSFGDFSVGDKAMKGRWFVKDENWSARSVLKCGSCDAACLRCAWMEWKSAGMTTVDLNDWINSTDLGVYINGKALSMTAVSFGDEAILVNGQDKLKIMFLGVTFGDMMTKCASCWKGLHRKPSVHYHNRTFCNNACVIDCLTKDALDPQTAEEAIKVNLKKTFQCVAGDLDGGVFECPCFSCEKTRCLLDGEILPEDYHHDLDPDHTVKPRPPRWSPREAGQPHFGEF